MLRSFIFTFRTAIMMPVKEQALLCFKISNLHFALSLDDVVRTVRAVEVAVVPDANELLHGLINYHSELIPVINLRHRFQMPTKEITPEDRFIIALANRKKVALVVDSVEEVKIVAHENLRSVAFPRSAIHPENNEEETDNFSFISLNQGIIRIYDLDKLINSEDQKHIEKVLSKATEKT